MTEQASCRRRAVHAVGKRRGFDAVLQQKEARRDIVEDAIHGGPAAPWVNFRDGHWAHQQASPIARALIDELCREARRGQSRCLLMRPPRVSMAQSRMAMASASLSHWAEATRAHGAITALSALPLPVTCRLMLPTGTPS